eukprot:2836982-Prymnesium_polylepis.2
MRHVQAISRVRVRIRVVCGHRRTDAFLARGRRAEKHKEHREAEAGGCADQSDAWHPTPPRLHLGIALREREFACAR